MLPLIMQDTDEGITTIAIQWQMPDKSGVAVVFTAGDDNATFSWADKDKYYAETSIDFRLSDGFPNSAKEIFKRIIKI